MRGYSVYYDISLCHRRLYMYIMMCGYTCIFTLKVVLHHSHFTMWLYHFMCGYTLNTWLYTFIYSTIPHAVMHHGIQLYPYIHICHRSIHIPTSPFMSPSQSTLARYFSYIHSVDYQTTSVQIVHRLSNDVEIFPHFFILTLSLNLNTLYLSHT